tara:strand:+ start:1568 stop:2206 length:639 start_codon:yes stop_codon:yes gene_type:complete
MFFLLYIIPRSKIYLIIKPMCWSWCLLGGQWLTKKGDLPDSKSQPYIYMFNHASMFDQFMLGAYVSHYLTAVAAIEVFNYPLFGIILKKYGIIPIVRGNIKKAMNSLIVAENAIKVGTSILIAPEGTRTISGDLGKFKKGPFHLAKNSKATIIPIGLIGAHRAKNKEDWRLTPGKLCVKIGNPISYSSFENMSIDELRDYTRKKIQLLINKR